VVDFSGDDKTVFAVYRRCAQSWLFTVHPSFALSLGGSRALHITGRWFWRKPSRPWFF